MLELLKQIFVGFWEYIKILYFVDHWEEAVILRTGKYHRSIGPGYHWKWFIFEKGLSANVKPDTMEIEAVQITTKDKKTISIGLMLDYEVDNIRKFLIEHNDSLTNIIDRSRGEMSDYLEDVEWEDIKKKTTKNALKRILIIYLEKMGVKLNDLKFTTKCEIRAYKFFTDKQKTNPTLS